MARSDELEDLFEILLGSRCPPSGTSFRLTFFSADARELESVKPELLRRTVWQGAAYATEHPRILVLGESWYGKRARLPDAIGSWIDGAKDNTFSRIFAAGTGLVAETVTREARHAFWDRVAFYNFAGHVGENRSDRPTTRHYLRGVDNLHQVLDEVQPDAVWVLGREQASYSKPVIDKRGIASKVATHPGYRGGVAAAELRDSWLDLLAAAEGIKE